MIISKVDITNYKGIKHLEMDLDQGVNLLIGNNGAGKTSLISSLAVLLSQSISYLYGV